MKLEKIYPKYSDGIIVSLLAIITLYFGWLFRNMAQDDAFITYRYARNIINGHGFVYNLNEPLLGTSTPLFCRLLLDRCREPPEQTRDSDRPRFIGITSREWIGERERDPTVS